MALLSLGRNVVMAEKVEGVASAGVKDANAVREEANKRLDEARRGILDALTPWIPGDFLVIYGILLTAWPGMRASFRWMIVIAGFSALSFVVLGAFAETGFKKRSDRSRRARMRLTTRTIAGFFVSLYASVAIPMSEWYDFDAFADNELPWVVTASALVAIVVLALKGVQKRYDIPLTG